MDADELRSILRESGVDVWTLIDTAISVAVMDTRNEEIKKRRDAIVERLYATRCNTCYDATRRRKILEEEEEEEGEQHVEEEEEEQSRKVVAEPSPPTPQSVDGGGDEGDDDRLYPADEEQIKILDIKEHLEDPHQSEDSLVNLLQELADMDITFKALQETDIGRHVNRLRKHSSSDVRRLVKQLVRKWKDLVDQWVKLSTPGENASSVSTLIADGDSPQPRSSQQSHNQVPDFAYSPNIRNASSGSDKNNSEPEPKPKPKVVPRRELPTQTKLTQSLPPKDSAIDPERLASARKRLHENYQEAQNAKKQRTIQVMDVHDIPKPKNNFFGRNKGGYQAKRW